MVGRQQFSPLSERVTVLLINAIIFYCVYATLNHSLIPSGDLGGVWLFSALALWFLTLLSSPWFLPPRDALVNAISSLSILVTLSLANVAQFRPELETIRSFSIAFTLIVVALSLIALFLHDLHGETSGARFAYRLTSILGRGEVLYTPCALISILGAYQTNYNALALITFLWTFFVVARPVEKVIQAAREWPSNNVEEAANPVAGTIERIDHPNIIRVRLTNPNNWQPGNLYIASIPGGDQRFVLALFTQIQGTDVMGTGLCVAPVRETISTTTGQVHLSHRRDKAEEFLSKLSGTPDAKLIGFTVENSTIGVVRFEVAMTTTIEEGDAIFARIDGQDVFYQIIEAETSEESFDQNPRGTHIVRAAQLGVYSTEFGFKKYPWLPAMNTPLFIAKSRAFDPIATTEREFIIGKVPSTNIGIPVNIDDLVEFHTAVLGVTGTGKTELALDIVRQSVKRGIKAFCVDFTGDYRHRLKDLKPIFPAPDSKRAKLLEGLLFMVDAYGYKAADDKKKLKELLDEIRTDTATKMADYLRSDDTNLAIFELADIANTKASLRLTEIYLSSIMNWARENRGARKILLCLEEAHTIVPEAFGSGFDGETKWVVERIGQIALQGRKYGVGLLVVTQRTALVSKTILSQCNTFFTHSLIDQTSLNFLESVYSTQHTKLIPNLGQFEFLATGKALKAERPILLKRDFDPAIKKASEEIRRAKTEPKELTPSAGTATNTSEVPRLEIGPRVRSTE